MEAILGMGVEGIGGGLKEGEGMGVGRGVIISTD